MPEPALATLGGGCFWCLEAVFRRLHGVHAVTSGYAGGHVPDPSYRDICTGTTGHAEVVQIRFDPDEVSFRALLEVFFAVHDPTTPNRQGADVGPQYRSIILHHDAEQEAAAREVMASIDEALDDPVVTELKPLEVFYPAEEDHHQYYDRNPRQAYCRLVIDPKLAVARNRFHHLLSAEARQTN